ncbi:adenosylcobinamide-GDP ribazoletransferase [Limibacillus sp. MBR-115]|uniref:adenosylcobinamide-GDP ribazoletransferase n=1 Tax=Limibacillus sp. MBR-115 TaxID=3156465 RepID=UPI0033908BAC
MTGKEQVGHMRQTEAALRAFLSDWLCDLKLSIIFFTRIPLAQPGEITPEAMTRALRAAPLVGGLVGMIAAGAGVLGWTLGLPPLVCGLLAVGASMLLTGCLHEDGLTDVADGFGGAFQRDRKLEIMKDSRTGTYGAAALFLSIGLRAAALSVLIPAGIAWVALPLAHAASRALIPGIMAVTPQARSSGLGAYHLEPERRVVVAALILGALVTLVLAGFGNALILLSLAATAAAAMRTLALRQIGGYTGDVLGATQQVGEITLLLGLTVLMS